MMDIHIIKRNGARATEQFSQTKLHTSIQAACLSVRSPEGEAKIIADKVCDAVLHWLATRSEVTSSDLRRKATDTLSIHHPEAAYLYKHHRLVI
jgi:transcriptional regulator NrdR family protein